MTTMTLEKKVVRLKLVADGLRRIQEFESARYLDEYAAYLVQPAQAVDVGKAAEDLYDWMLGLMPGGDLLHPAVACDFAGAINFKKALATKLRALSGEKAGAAGDGVSSIAAERQRQREVEGWAPEHDAEHKNATLTRAAISYAFFAASSPEVRDQVRRQMPDLWPWEMSWWKPGSDNSHASRIRELVKAGALIAAEIDRLSLPASPTPGKEG